MNAVPIKGSQRRQINVLGHDTHRWIRRLSHGGSLAAGHELGNLDVPSRMQVVAVAVDNLVGESLKLVNVKPRFQAGEFQ